jgi:hypothetical protein
LISERTWDIILGSESGKEVKTESEPTYSESEYDNPGTLGDQFGMANALFSGMALAGIILAVLLQTLELKYQRAELRNTRSVFMNSYHLQAMKAVYDSLDDATAINSKKKKAAIQSLEAAIKYMRLAGEIDKYQMDAIREGVRSSLKESEVFEKIAKVSVADSIVNMTNSADECFHLVNDIDQIYPGNGLLEPLLDHVKDLLKKCNHLRNSYVRNDYRSGGLVETPMAEIELGKLDEVRGLCNKSRSEIAELIRDE